MTALDSIMEHKDEGISLSAPVIMELIAAVHEKGASFRFQARGSSMTPSIRDGDVITVSPLGDGKPRCGDVLAFRHPKRPQMLVHRVLRKKGGNFLIRGDNCPNLDGWIPARDLLGVISRVERNGNALFWPDRKSVWGRWYNLLFTMWLPLRRFLVRGYCSIKTRIIKKAL